MAVTTATTAILTLCVPIIHEPRCPPSAPPSGESRLPDGLPTNAVGPLQRSGALVLPAFNNARLVPSDRYAALLTAIAAAVRAVAPGMPIVVGALLSDTSGAPEKRPAAYMTAVGHCAAATGTRQQPWDNVSLHPYVDPAALAGEITAVQASLTALGGPPRLWITEIDYNLCHAANSPQQQADKLTAAVTVARATGIAECVLWFTFHDWGDGWSCSDPGQMMGLCTVGPDQRIRQRRPAWEAFQRLVTTQ